MVKTRQTLSSSELFRTGQTYLLSALFIAAASRHHEESHLICGPLESILLDQGFFCHLFITTYLLNPRATFSGDIHARN